LLGSALLEADPFSLPRPAAADHVAALVLFYLRRVSDGILRRGTRGDENILVQVLRSVLAFFLGDGSLQFIYPVGLSGAAWPAHGRKSSRGVVVDHRWGVGSAPFFHRFAHVHN